MPIITTTPYVSAGDPVVDAPHDYVTSDFRISVFVWHDSTGEGLINQSEIVGINGVTVFLFDGGGAPLASGLTAGGGLFVVTFQAPGNYEVQVTLPGGYTGFTLQGVGGNPLQNSTVNGSGTTGVFAHPNSPLADNKSYVQAGLVI